MEIPISRNARNRIETTNDSFTPDGNITFENFQAVRKFAHAVTSSQRTQQQTDSVSLASEIAGIGLITEIFHYLIKYYQQQIAPDVFNKALKHLYQVLGKNNVEKTLIHIIDEFPPPEVYSGEKSSKEYLNSKTNQRDNRIVTLEKLILLWLTNANPACAPYLDIFNDEELRNNTAYHHIFQSLQSFFKNQPPVIENNQSLLEMLQEPATLHPHSIEKQLDYILQNWGAILGDFLSRILKQLDFIKEEKKRSFAGHGIQHVPSYQNFNGDLDEEGFSQDQDWMPKLVLIAKNTYVWLHQLSQKYKRQITHLDHIPNEELEELATWGITGLWLIGVWERSSASQKIKVACGNQDAVSSAYSLFDYVIAEDLGGEKAYSTLQKRARKHGIRIAADMVPNHVGIYSKWIIEHPDWFISLDYSPFPTYSFNGPDLSDDPNLGIYIEDHYYDKSDAAVVFKRVDMTNGDTRFIYHGNDGTSMPWNDTAQLNYLKPGVREAVIQTILKVAKKFPIIRFDAAMTLTKKHYQRLWFPEPGSGGDIPTRAEFGMTKEQFDQAMPKEFWREVVDRVAIEAPDTLLLAEAFWLMEGYFVRTLGMHRVYNSAFMNMLRDEKNAEYRQLIKNTLAFDPQILKRYVNFMNNPDEETAVKQFGKGDKYFGICTLLATLPGLPMFGHGQIEGFSEKYGMEFKKPYWDEIVDFELVERHKREIFPLLRKRTLFADVEHFHLFDFYTPEGKVDEDVIAYTNGVENNKCLVIFHNKWAETSGWINSSAEFRLKEGDNQKLVKSCLGTSLGLTNSPNYYTIFKDHTTGLEYIRSNQEIFNKGMYFELKAYKYHVFLNFREVKDTDWGQYAQLNEFLNGRGVPDINQTIKELLLQPIHKPFADLVNPGMLHWLMENISIKKNTTENVEGIISEVEQKANRLFSEICKFTRKDTDVHAITQEIAKKTQIILNLPLLSEDIISKTPSQQNEAMQFISRSISKSILEPKTRSKLAILFTWLFVHLLGKPIDQNHYEAQSELFIDEWMLGKIISQAFIGLGFVESTVAQSVQRVKLLTRYQNWHRLLNNQSPPNTQFIESLFSNTEIKHFLHFNQYHNILWFNKEAYEDLLYSLLDIAAVQILYQYPKNHNEATKQISHCFQTIQFLVGKAASSNYQVETFLKQIRSD